MDLLNVEYNLIQAKRAYLRFTFKKKCCICDTPISDKVLSMLYSILLFTQTQMYAIKLALRKKRLQFAQSPNKIFKKHSSIDLCIIKKELNIYRFTINQTALSYAIKSYTFYYSEILTVSTFFGYSLVLSETISIPQSFALC